MLKINSINNVYNTLNSPHFGNGVRTNYGIQAPSPQDNMVEGSWFTGFVGTIAPLFEKTQERAKSIEKGLNETKINYVA